MSFIAKFRGRCGECENTIEVGEEAEYDEDDQVVHKDCSVADNARKQPPLCTQCWLTHVGECP